MIHSAESKCRNHFAGGIYAYKEVAPCNEYDAQRLGKNKSEKHTLPKNPFASFDISCTVILAGKAHTCLGNGIYRDIQKSKYIIGSCISCHSHRAKGVDRGLKERIGKIDHCTLDSRRNPYLENLFQVFFLYGKPGKAQLIASL